MLLFQHVTNINMLIRYFTFFCTKLSKLAHVLHLLSPAIFQVLNRHMLSVATRLVSRDLWYY